MFKVQDKLIPIVHRVIETNALANGTSVYLTKGDNNHMDDRIGFLYADNQYWLQRSDILGRAIGCVLHTHIHTLS